MHKDYRTAEIVTVSWEQVYQHTVALASQIAGLCAWRGIVAISRGGLVPAAILAHELDIRRVETVVVTSYEARVQGPARLLKGADGAGEGEGWLIVDDLVDSGATATVVRASLPKSRFVAVYAKPDGLAAVDNFAVSLAQGVWLRFPWEGNDLP
ncbi:MAG: xanthine phosphoribosyltransferase [Alphaproteobacteria bacterium]|nr:xanthine phosphoribosyltransferase [Alphaproteobacteria bacterium]